MTQPFAMSEYHRQLIVRSEGRLSTLVTYILNGWMLNASKVGDLLEAATGKKEYELEDFEKAAEFLMKCKV